MNIQLTACAYNTDLQRLGWEVTPYNIAVVINPPETQVNLKVFLDDQKERSGGYTLIWPNETRHIDEITHHALLEKSISEHNNIWKTLAEK